MSKLLEEHDFETAAYEISCDVAAVKSVAEVESAGAGFLQDGRAKILFEGHIFHKYTAGRYEEAYPDICYKKWTKQFYLGGAGEYTRLKKAEGLDRTAARMSASYGKFQIMGFNFAICGYTSVDSFYDAMQVDEGQHLSAFIGYVQHVGLDKALREHRWMDFAKRYNGPEYWKNSYDKKIAEAYKKYAKQA